VGVPNIGLAHLSLLLSGSTQIVLNDFVEDPAFLPSYVLALPPPHTPLPSAVFSLF
jgi:hypothetical protein